MCVIGKLALFGSLLNSHLHHASQCCGNFSGNEHLYCLVTSEPVCDPSLPVSLLSLA